MLLGIDYGDSKIGLAISSGVVAAPLSVVRYKDQNELLRRLKKISEEERAEKLVVGISEKDSEQKARDFGEKLSKHLGLPVEFADETLSSKDAQMLSIEAGIKRKKRKNMEDAFAAALILQGYLDS
jgi:putative Holliday junction resolvase